MDFNPTTANTAEILIFLNRAFAKADNGFNAYNDNNQIYIEDKSGNKTSTFIIPTQEERIITEKHSDTFVEIQLYNTGLISDAVKIKTTQLYSQKKLESLFGVKAFRCFEDHDWKQLFNIIRCLLIETPQSITYSTLGWSDNNANFLYGNIKITSTEVVAIKSNLVQQAPNITDISANDACAFIEQIMNNLCNNCFVSYTLLSYYMLSLLKSRFYADFRFCPSFALAIVGKSGTGKTSTVMPLMNPLALETSCFEDSMASIRHTFKRNNNGCTVIDDFKCSSVRYTGKFEEIIRLSGDISSNGKRVGDNTVCTGMAVFTGEECPKLQTSSFPRLLLIELESNSINFNCLSALTDGIDKYTYFIINFIKFIMNQQNFANDFVNSVKSKRNDIISSSQIQMHPRYYEMYSWLSVMWQYLKEFMDNYSVELSFDYEAALLEHIVSQDEKFNIDPLKLFARTFFELKESNKFIITDYNGMKEGAKYEVLETSDELFLKSGEVYDKITDHLNKNNITFPYTEVTLRQELYERGILDKRNSKSLTTEKKDRNNKGTSGIILSKHIFKKIGGFYNE